MDRLSQIRKEIAAEHGYSSWAEFGVMESRMKLSIMHDEVALRYATEMVRHNLERAAGQARVIHYQHDHGSVIDKESIINTEIELI